VLHLYQSNRLEHLFQLFARVMRAQPLASPFAQEIVVVQSKGMGRWLNFRLAREQGIAANIQYPLPASFFWDVLNRMLGTQKPRSVFSPEVLTLRILRWLENADNLLGAPVLAAYLQDGGDFRRYSLANRLADVLDQYLIYRPDWLQAWERGEQPLNAPDALWQARLWRDLVNDAVDEHRASSLQRMLQMLERGEGVQRLPQRVMLVGISSLPPVYLQLLKLLGQHIEVAFFALNPCALPWGDIRDLREQARLGGDSDPTDLYLDVGNPLLAAWGKQGRDFFDSLADVPQLHDVFDEPEAAHSLLACLQQDVLTLTDRPSGEPYQVADDDRSLQVHVCHSPMREVEVLHDQLLALFNADASLQPADVVVLTPDIELYAPFIDAVFAPHPGTPPIPYSIADRSEAAASPLAQVFLSLLGLAEQRFSVDWVLGLLDSPAIRARFGLEEADLPRIQHWVNATHTRWGRDAEHKAEFGLPPTAQNSWREGLTRLLLGVALPQAAQTDGLPLYAGLLPFDDVEGAQAQIAARFAQCVESLFQQAQALQAPRPLSEWAHAVAGLCDAVLLAESDSDIALLQRIRERLQALRDLSQQADYQTPVGLPVLRAWLSNQLESRSAGGGFLTGGVTFCTMVPMRSLPFRVICVLGMDDATFPRRLRPMGFDLISRFPRFGDRSRRADDRFLFLETLLSARDVFYVSYVGRDIRSDAELPPSILLNDLLDTVAKGCVPAEVRAGEARLEAGKRLLAQIVTQHPLQPFDLRYFSGDARLPGFHAGWARAAQLAGRGNGSARSVFDAALPEPDDSWRQLEVAELRECLDNPTRYLLQQRCGLSEPRAAVELRNSEPFDLAFQDKSLLRKQAWQILQQDLPLPASTELARASGVLPHGPWGERRQQHEAALTQHIHTRALPWLQQTLLPPQAWRVLGPQRLELSGWLAEVRPSGNLLVLRGKASAFYLLQAWLDHLALCQLQPAGATLQTTIVAEDGIWQLRRVDDPQTHWRTLLGIYWQALQQPLPLFRKTSSAYARVLAAGPGKKSPEEHQEAASKAASGAWLGNSFSDIAGEVEQDAWLHLVWAAQDPLAGEFDALARQVWLPLYQHLQALHE
jgi:exodeoxyribonuclease V gamma subunit